MSSFPSIEGFKNRHGPVISEFRPTIESAYSDAVSAGIERPIVLLLETTNDPTGREFVDRFFPSHPDVERLTEKSKETKQEVYFCTAVSLRDALAGVLPRHPIIESTLTKVPPGHFPLFVTASGDGLFCALPVPVADRERPVQIADRIAWLRQSRDEQCRIADALVVRMKGQSHPMAAIVISIIQRSFSHIDGFIEMIERRNVYCAIPILRLQVDNMLRLSAFDLVDDHARLTNSILQNTPLQKIRARDGNALTDAHLCRHLSVAYPWIERVYKDACGFVHFSGSHIFAAIRGRSMTRSQESMVVSSLTFEIRERGPFWGDRGVLDALDSFKLTTQGLMELCRRWSNDVSGGVNGL
jgi:hypothetical protein